MCQGSAISNQVLPQMAHVLMLTDGQELAVVIRLKQKEKLVECVLVVIVHQFRIFGISTTKESFMKIGVA